MSGIEIVEQTQLVNRIPLDVDVFVASASYEERAHSVYETVFRSRKTPTYVFYNGNHETYLRGSVERLMNGSTDATSIALDSDDPRVTFESLKKAINTIGNRAPRHIGIDVTGFTREALAMLLRVCKEYLPSECKITSYYHRANRYAQDSRRGWLSQGIKDVRSVIGYAGRVKVSAEIHLILIAGFEIERAMAIVDVVGPSRITLGVLASRDKTRDAENPHAATLEEFINRTEAMCMGIEFAKIEFSPSDSVVTRDAIRAIPRRENENTAIACLNSKPAMIGACVAAIGLPDIQLVYAQPSAYNIADYSQPSQRILISPIDWL